MPSEFKPDALVWAKLASYPFWPGRVTRLKDVRDKEIREQLGEQQSGQELIWFFGTKNYGWVASNMVVPYDDGYDEKAKNKRAKALKGFVPALKEAEAWKSDPKKGGDDKDDEKGGSKGEDSKKEDHRKKKEEEDKEREEEKRKKKEEKEEKKEKKRKEEERRKEEKKEDEKKKRRESEVVRRKEEKKVDDKDRRHSDAGERVRKSDVDEKPASKKRKASEEEEEAQTHKRAKLAESTPKRERKREDKKLGTPKEEKMETEGPVTVVDGNKHDAKPVEKMDMESPAKKQTHQPHVVKGLLMLARHPVSKYHKLEFMIQGEGFATAKAHFSDARPSSKYEVHAVLGATYFLVDITCYAALLSSIREGDSAITQDIHVTVLAPIPQGNEVIVKAKVVSTKPKAGLVFLDGEVWFGEKLMATARVVKSMIEPDLPVKESTKEEREKDRKENNNQSP